MRFQPPLLIAILIAFGLLPTAVGQQPQSVILRPRTASSSNPTVPQVHVSADKQRVPRGTLVTFTLSPASVANDPRYVVTLYFGDGQHLVMRKPVETHPYQFIGTFTYSVAITQSQNNNSNDKVPSVIFSASPATARAGDLVTFTAKPSGPYPNLEYRFVYGDGSVSPWQTGAQSEHVYQRTGNFFAYVDIGDGKQRLAGSARKQIAISSAQPLTVSLRATQPARAGIPVTFNARTFPANANAKYQFIFGDGQQTLQQVNAQARHVYKSSGSYNAYVQVSQSDNAQNSPAKSSPILVSVQPTIPGPTPNPSPSSTPNPSPQPTPSPSDSPTPTPEPSPAPTDSPSPNTSPSVVDAGTTGTVGGTASTPSFNSGNQNNGGVRSIRWWYWLFAGVLLLLLFKATGYLFAAKPTFAAFSDPGVAAITNQKEGLPLDFQLVLNPNVSAGDYSVTSEASQLITNTDNLENRQVLEI
jgi:outer membrane biosynthesis protein TonB